MRIAHFVQGRCNPDSANGVDKTVFFLSSAQAALGHSVGIFALSAKPVIEIPGVETRNYASFLQRFAAPDALVSQLRSWEPSVVHLHSAYVPPNIMLAQRLRRDGIPYVVTPNGVLSSALLNRRPYLKLPYKYMLERPYLNRAAFVHAVGDAEEINKYGVTAPIVFAPNGFNLAALPEGLSPGLLQTRLPQFAGRPVALFLGRLDVMQKGLDLLLQSLAVAAQQSSDLALVLVGPDWQGGRERLRELVSRLGLDDRVAFWGPAFGREKFELLASADLFVHPSRWEGLPFALIEALAVGRPCVVTPAADPVAFVSRSGAGRTVDTTVEQLAAALAGMARLSREQLDQQGRAGRRLVEEELSWARIAETLTSAYAQYCNAS